MDDLWATKSEGVGLIDRAINFQDFQPTRYVILIHQRHRQTDGQTDERHAISIPRYALVHRAVMKLPTTSLSGMRPLARNPTTLDSCALRNLTLGTNRMCRHQSDLQKKEVKRKLPTIDQ